MDHLPPQAAACAVADSFTAGPQFAAGHRWKVLGVGVAANACFSMIFAGLPSTAVAMRSDYHLSNSDLGLVLGCLGLGVALSELPWGLLTDRWGDRRVLLAGLGSLVVWLVLMLALLVPSQAYAPTVSFLAANLLVVGLLGGSVNGSSGRAIMAWFSEGERGFAMSIRQTAIPLGGGLGALLLPSLAEAFGFAAVYSLLAAAAAACTFFTWLWLHEPQSHRAVKPGIPLAKPATAPLRSVAIWRLAVAVGVLCFPQVAVLTFTTVFLHDFAGIGTLVTSAALAAVQIGAMVMRVWSGRWTDRHRNRRAYLRFCALLSGIAFAVLTLLVALAAPGSAAFAAALVATLVLAGISVSSWHGVAYAEIATLAGASRAGSALGLANTLVFVGFFLVPLSIPHLLAATSWAGIWMAAAACALIAWPILLKPEPQA
ncbi:MFS transporter [Mesorhizobium sp. Pch-S]|uniref:MFS transporter n=1 Tax=Mesorhizobium sp. Pch-S TaxID=2082387 RepID=UPI001FE1A6A8|nr:MFS transporter [Mesorhizobium sp. Pch-S]